MRGPDHRVFFAAERTLLAWVRTGIALIGLGFVVARFGLFLRLASATHVDQRTDALLLTGIGVTGLGAVACAGAALRFRRLLRGLGERPAHWSPAMPIVMAWTLAIGGLLLGVASIR
ncbi:MAG: DUF202 domain-containing protein [bacterium]